MAVLKLDPPPQTDDVRVLQAYCSELYEAVKNTLYNLDEDNFSEDYLNRINGGGS